MTCWDCGDTLNYPNNMCYNCGACNCSECRDFDDDYFWEDDEV